MMWQLVGGSLAIVLSLTMLMSVLYEHSRVATSVRNMTPQSRPPDNFPKWDQYSEAGRLLDTTDQVVWWGYARAMEKYVRPMFEWMASTCPAGRFNAPLGTIEPAAASGQVEQPPAIASCVTSYVGSSMQHMPSCGCASCFGTRRKAERDRRQLENEVMGALSAPTGSISTDAKRKILITALNLGIFSFQEVQKELIKLHSDPPPRPLPPRADSGKRAPH